MVFYTTLVAFYWSFIYKILCSKFSCRNAQKCAAKVEIFCYKSLFSCCTNKKKPQTKEEVRIAFTLHQKCVIHLYFSSTKHLYKWRSSTQRVGRTPDQKCGNPRNIQELSPGQRKNSIHRRRRRRGHKDCSATMRQKVTPRGQKRLSSSCAALLKFIHSFSAFSARFIHVAAPWRMQSHEERMRVSSNANNGPGILVCVRERPHCCNMNGPARSQRCGRGAATDYERCTFHMAHTHVLQGDPTRWILSF